MDRGIQLGPKDALLRGLTILHPKDNGGWLMVVRHRMCGKFLHPNIPVPVEQMCECAYSMWLVHGKIREDYLELVLIR